MKQEIEIEEKFILSNKAKLLNLLRASGYRLSAKKQQADTYFVDRNDQFLKDNTCLRIRSSNNQNFATIDYKGPSSDPKSSKISKIETNVKIGSASIVGIKTIFSALGFREYVTVDKSRTTWIKANEICTLSVSIDTVKSAGDFVEIEATAPINSNAEYVAEVWQAEVDNLKVFLGTTVLLPYRDLVAEKI